MPLLVQRTFSASNKALRKTAPVDVQSKKELSAKQSVQFSPNVKVQEIPHLHDLSLEEIEQSWYSPEEMRAIKDDAVQVIKRIVTGKMEKDDCLRGLEHRVPEASKLRKQTKRSAFMTVWESQEDQWEDGVTDLDAISIKYQMQTINSKEAALEMGMQDEEEARVLLEEAKKMVTKLSSTKSFLSKFKR